jgi:muramoyltetrapeptide carboxypeptidase LdcA involved in peptidoglycan recycling
MIKPQRLNKGDKVAIVSLSRGLLGMPFCKHELDIAIKRLKEFGLEPVIMPNALKDMEYIEKHPEARASDLKEAFMDKSIKAVITAIGGIDTYKTIPYLMGDQEFIDAVKNNPKIFTGFSDTTNNHLMFSKIGLMTFYGPCILVDFAELDNDMLPYTKEYFEKFFNDDNGYEITISPVWYSDRKSYGVEEIGKPREKHQETHGYEVLKGSGTITGKLYGGCIESIYDAYTGTSFKDEPSVYEKYQIFPTEEEWKEKVLFLETSELSAKPEELEIMLMELKKRNIFDLVKGIIVGKPIDENYYEEYKEVYKKVFHDLDTPILYNVNFGHSVPRCILPYGALATIDYDNKKIFINESIFDE